MAHAPSASGLERPWHRPGAGRYAFARVRGITRPPITMPEPAPGSVVGDLSVAVRMRDGVVLRVNVYRPPGDEPLAIAGRRLWPTNPLTGNFPARYSQTAAWRCTLHWGPERPACLHVPRIPPPRTGEPAHPVP